MNDHKSKELYAKLVYRAIGNLDDDLIIEAREPNRESAQSKSFRFEKLLAFAAAFLLVVGASFFGIHALIQAISVAEQGPVSLSDAAASSGIRASIAPTDTAGEYSLVFEDFGTSERFYFTFENYAGDLTVTYKDSALQTVVIGGDVYYIVDVSSASHRLGTVTLRLCSTDDIQALEDCDIRVRFDVRDPGATTHPIAES